jgi:hypothetical protein
MGTNDDERPAETAGVSTASERVLGPQVALLGDLLAALLERDRVLASDMNAAERRLLGAVEQVQAVTALGAGRGLADTVRQGFVDYQHAAEDRRGLGGDVGEAVVRLVDAMTAAGFTERQARNADVWALRDGVYRGR